MHSLALFIILQVQPIDDEAHYGNDALNEALPLDLLVIHGEHSCADHTDGYQHGDQDHVHQSQPQESWLFFDYELAGILADFGLIIV